MWCSRESVAQSAVYSIFAANLKKMASSTEFVTTMNKLSILMVNSTLHLFRWTVGL